MQQDDFEAVARLASGNREALLTATGCGCFSCCRVFPASTISTYLAGDPSTALCPYCGIDSVIPATPDRPLTTDLLRAMQQHGFGANWPYAPPPLWKRLLGYVVGLLGLAIAGLTLWSVWMFLTTPPEPDNATTPLTLYSICFILTFIACAAILFSLRLGFPRLRVGHGRIIGRQGMLAFLLLYGLLVTMSLWQGSIQAKGFVLLVALMALTRYAWRSTFGRKPPDKGDLAV